MFENLEITRMAQALSLRSGERLGLIARNVANADTPGYQALDLPDFAETYRSGAMTLPMRQTRSGHLGEDSVLPRAEARRANGTAAPNGNSVSLEGEMVKAVEVRQDNDMALSVYRSSTEILRACLGRSK